MDETRERRVGGIVGEETAEAENLEPDMAAELLELRGVEPRDRRLDRRHLPPGLERDGAVAEEPGGLVTDAQLGEHAAHVGVAGEAGGPDVRDEQLDHASG